MTDHRPTPGNKSSSQTLPLGGSAAPELGHGNGDDFVARLDLAKAERRFRAMLDASASTTPEAEEAKEHYEVLDAKWNVAVDIDVDMFPPGQCEVHEVYGVIRHFNASAGYGFIVPDNGLPEATLHATTLKLSGFVVAPLGATVACQLVQTPDGLRVHRVFALDASTATPPSQLPKDEPYPAEPESAWEEATVKWFDPARGFGYLAVETRRMPIYCQIETLRRFGLFELRPEQLIRIRWGQTAKGATVAEIRYREELLL